MKAWTQNLHMHSTFDDGKDSCRKMLLACRKAGLRSAGVTLHSPLPFPNDWSGRSTPPFSLEMGVIRRELAPFHVYTGIEVDSRSRDLDLKAFDYVIGAVHFLGGGEIPLSVDESPEISRRLVNECFGGSADRAAQAYYEEVVRHCSRPEVDIVAHLDLITKFQETDPLYDPDSPKIHSAAMEAVRALVREDKIFEINTGAMSRGYRTSPYPRIDLLEEIARLGGRVTISSDAHSADAVTFGFDQALGVARQAGLRELWQLSGQPGKQVVFDPVPV